MWLNHMMQPENPLSNGKSYDFEYYGDDPDGPTPLNSDNNVVVEEIDLGQHDSLQSFVLERLDPLRLQYTFGSAIFFKFGFLGQNSGQRIISNF